MTEGWLVSTRSDRGGGFRHDPERSSPSLPADIAAEFASLEPLYPQLAVGGAPDADGLAVVTYRYSSRLGAWIVVVQGSAGEYGPAGAIQLAVLPGTLLDAMSGSLPAVRREGWIRPGATDRPRITLKAAGPEVSRALSGLLALDDSRRVLLLPGGQGEVDQLLVRLARILPEGVAQRYTWSTSLAAARIEAGEMVISGEWPDELRARHTDIHRAFASRIDDPGTPSGRRMPRGLAWAAGEAAERRYPGRRSSASDLRGWVEELEARRPWTLDEALELLSGPVEGSQARRWADGEVSARLLADDVERLETLLTHPSEVVSSGAVGALEQPGVWEQLVRIERRRASRGKASMLPPGLLPADALVLLAEDVAGGRPATARTDYLAGLVRRDPALLAPVAVETARQGSGADVGHLLAAFPTVVTGRGAAESFLRECSAHLEVDGRPEDGRAVRWTLAEAVARVNADNRTRRAVVDDATDAAVLRFATGLTQTSAGDPGRLGSMLTWFVLVLVSVAVVALVVAVILVL